MAQSLEDAKLRIIIDASTSRDSMKRGEERSAERERKRREDAERGEKAQRRRFAAGPGRRGGRGFGRGPGRGRFGFGAASLVKFVAIVEGLELLGRVSGGTLEAIGGPLSPVGRLINKIVTQVITKQKLEITSTLGAFDQTKAFVAAMKAAGVDITIKDAANFFATSREILKAEGFSGLAQTALTAAQTGPVMAIAIASLVKAIGMNFIAPVIDALQDSPEFKEVVREEVREQLERATNPKAHR